VEGPGKWSAPGPVLAVGGPAKRYRLETEWQTRVNELHHVLHMS